MLSTVPTLSRNTMLLSELQEVEEESLYPPQVCDECGETISDGFGWYSEDTVRILCTGCALPHTRRIRK